MILCRSKIQEESLYYESLKHSGKLPIIGVNTFLSDEGSPTIIPQEVIRSTTEEKAFQIAQVQALQARHPEKSNEMLKGLQETAVTNQNLFTALMEATKYCSLGQISQAMYEVGGQYRRNMSEAVETEIEAEIETGLRVSILSPIFHFSFLAG